MTATLLLAVVAARVPAQQVVLVFPDGHTKGYSAAAVPAAEMAQAAVLWAWAEGVPPQRFAPPGPTLPQLQIGGNLEVKITPPSPPPPPEKLVVVAGPKAMWEEVPEPLLPRYPVSRQWRVKLPTGGDEPWRFRVYGAGFASPWLEAPRLRQASLAKAAAVALQVVDDGGAPAERFTVQVFATSLSAAFRGFCTFYDGEKGHLALPELPPEGHAFALMAKGFPPALVEGSLPRRVVLQQGGEILGQVVGPDGKPLAGVQVEVEYFLAPFVPRLMQYRAKSDRDGRFRFVGMPLGPKVVRLSKPGFVSELRRESLEGPQLDLGVVGLRAGVELPVRVTEESGLPIPQASVWLKGNLQGQTDPQGNVRLRDVDPQGSLDLKLEASGFLPLETQLVPPFPPVLTLTLRRAYMVKGRVLCGGVEAAGGQLQVEQGSSLTFRELAGGTFQLALEPEKPYTLTVMPTDCRPRTLPIPAGAPGEVRDLGDVVCSKGAVVRAQLLGAQGQPVVGARVWTVLPSVGGPLLALAQNQVVQAFSDSSGVVQLAGLPAGTYLLRGEAQDFARWHAEVALEEDELRDLGVVQWDSGREVVVRVVPEGGAERARIDLRGLWNDADFLERPVENGRAVFPHVPLAHVLLTLWRGKVLVHQEEVHVTSGAKPQVVTCEVRKLEVKGTVTVGGVPAGGTLVFMPPAAPVAGVIRQWRSPGGAQQQSVLGQGPSAVEVPVDEDGTFVTTQLLPGTWRVVLHLPGGGVTPQQSVVLGEGETVEVALAFPGNTVTGKVQDEDGKPVAGARVQELGSGLTTLSRAGGEFSLAGLPAGQARFMAQLGPASSPVQSVLLGSSEPVRDIVLTLGESNPATVVVRLEGAGGVGFVFLESEDGRSSLLSTDGTGQARFPLPPPAPSRVRAAAYAGGLWALGDWVSVSEPETTINLAVSCGGTLELRAKGGLALDVGVQGPGGWEMSRLVGFLGQSSRLSEEGPVRLSGLPPGAFTVSSWHGTQSAEVRCGETSTVTVEACPR